MTTEMLEEVERVVQPVDNRGWYAALAQLPGYTGERPALPRGGAVSATHQWGQPLKRTQTKPKAPVNTRSGLVRRRNFARPEAASEVISPARW